MVVWLFHWNGIAGGMTIGIRTGAEEFPVYSLIGEKIPWASSLRPRTNESPALEEFAKILKEEMLPQIRVGVHWLV